MIFPPPDRAVRALACTASCDFHETIHVAAAARNVRALEQLATVHPSPALLELIALLHDEIKRGSEPPEGT